MTKLAFQPGTVVPEVGEQLTKKQKEQLEDVLSEFSTVLQATPGGTDLCEHRIETGDVCPIRLPHTDYHMLTVNMCIKS